MDPDKQHRPLPLTLKQQDISQVIKHFSFAIQQRLQEIEKNCNYFTCLNSINYDKTDLQKDIINKYNDYKTSDQNEIKLLQKFVERILQIFQFFRQKTDQPEILQQMAEKISQKLRQILKNETNYQFFVNNRPKTHSTQVKPVANRSAASNDFLSIIGPSCYKAQLDINAVFVTNKKVRTQTSQKRVVEVGKLFKYVFSVLKRGYLIKLRMQRPEKKSRTVQKQNHQKTYENSTISIEGTCAIVKNSQKANKQNEGHATRALNFCKQKLNIANPLSIFNQNKRQFQVSQKMKNCSISTAHYSILSSMNPSALKQSSSKVRELDKKVNGLYEILNIEKHSVVRVAKDPEMWKKEQQKRNLMIENERKKYVTDYGRWKTKDKCSNDFQHEMKKITQNVDQEQERLKQQQAANILQQREDQTIQLGNNHNRLIESQQSFPLENIKNFVHGESILGRINIKTEQNQYLDSECDFGERHETEQGPQTIVICSSRPYSKLKDNALSDKSSNLNSKLNEFFITKSNSLKQNERKSLRLNLPNMLGDKSSIINEPNKRLQNLTINQKNPKQSEKSQLYFQNYHMDSIDESVFVPLLPRKEKNSENQGQIRNEFSIKKKNLLANFHPLNRCRLFREKKTIRNSMIIPLMQGKTSEIDSMVLNRRLKNAIM